MTANFEHVRQVVSAAEAEIDACGRRQTAMRKLAQHYDRLADHAEGVARKCRLRDRRDKAEERAKVYRNVAQRIMEVAK